MSYLPFSKIKRVDGDRHIPIQSAASYSFAASSTAGHKSILAELTERAKDPMAITPLKKKS